MDNREIAHGWPQVLPGGGAVLFTVFDDEPAIASSGRIAVLSLETGEQHDVLDRGSHGRYVSSGHVVYGIRDTLQAVGFDLNRLEAVGNPVSVLERVATNEGNGAANFAVADQGTLVYLAGETLGAPTSGSLVWVDWEGREERLAIDAGFPMFPRVSPDGRRIVFADYRDGLFRQGVDEPIDVWTYDLVRQTLARLRFDPTRDTYPLMTPDGRHVVFRSDRDGPGLYSKAADGTGWVSHVASVGDQGVIPEAWPADGDQLIFYTLTTEANRDLYVVAREGQATPEPLLNSPYNEVNAAVSPDGAWLAYASDESGDYEVYIRPFPNVEDGWWQISTRGGHAPIWGRGGRELFYLAGGVDPWTRTQVVRVATGDRPPVVIGDPEVLFEGRYISHMARPYDISPDGQGFLMTRETDPVSPPQVVLVQSWLEEVKARVPPP